MKLSIIIPVYNCDKYIARCMDTINNFVVPYMDKDDIEVIIINDGSTDNSENICLNLQKRFSFIKFLTQDNNGASKARNQGIETSTGEFIWFIDADDTVCPVGVKEIINQIYNDNTNPDIFAFNYTRNTPTGEIAYNLYNEHKYVSSIDFMDNNPSMYLWNKIYSRKAIGDTRFLDGTKNIEDFLFNIEILSKQLNVYEIPIVGYSYDDSNINSTSRSRSKRNLIKIHKDSISVHKKIIDLLNVIDDKRTYNVITDLLNFSILGHLYSLSIYYNNKHIRKAIKFYKNNGFYPIRRVNNRRANIFRVIANHPILLQSFSKYKRTFR